MDKGRHGPSESGEGHSRIEQRHLAELWSVSLQRIKGAYGGMSPFTPYLYEPKSACVEYGEPTAYGRGCQKVFGSGLLAMTMRYLRWLRSMRSLKVGKWSRHPIFAFRPVLPLVDVACGASCMRTQVRVLKLN